MICGSNAFSDGMGWRNTDFFAVYTTYYVVLATEIPMTQELSRKWRQEEVYEALGIGKSTYYTRLSFLGIEPSKDENGAYLTSEEMETMQELNLHIRETGKMKGFRGSGQLAVAESDLGLALEMPIMEESDFEVESDGALERLIREAGVLKMKQEMMPELVKLHLASQMSEYDLPDDLKQQLKAVREAANPKQDAATMAQQLLQRHRQNQSQNQSPNRQNP